MKPLQILLLLLLLAVPAHTQSDSGPENVGASGNKFFEICAVVDKNVVQLAPNEALFLMHCVGYIQGIFDTMMFYDDMHFGPHVFCPPKVQMNQAVRVVRKYIGEHPEEAHERTMDLAWAALVKAFPCNVGK